MQLDSRLRGNDGQEVIACQILRYLGRTTKFARAMHLPNSTKVGHITKPLGCLHDFIMQLGRSNIVALLNVINYLHKVEGSLVTPLDLQHGFVFCSQASRER